MSTETETPKKSFLTRAMMNVRAKENGEVTEETATQQQMIKKIAVAGGVVVAGTVAISLVLKSIAKQMKEVTPEEEITTED